MKRDELPSPLVGEGGSIAHRAIETGEGSVSAERDPSSAFAFAKALSPTRGEGKKKVSANITTGAAIATAVAAAAAREAAVRATPQRCDRQSSSR